MKFKERLNKVENIRSKLLKIAESRGTPLYIFDKDEVLKNLRSFKNAFKKNGLDINIFYAVKSNYYLGLLKTIVKEASYLDVSSPREFKLALKAGAKKIIYTGPAKKEADFELLSKYHSRVIINLESLRELKILGKIAEKNKVKIKCGLRIITENQAGWTKFGMPLSSLKKFYSEALKYKALNFCGVHFHISMNKTPEPYTKTLKELADYFKKNFNEKERQGFEYIDIGGGFYPDVFEALYPWNLNQEIKYFDKKKIIKEIIEEKINPRYLMEEATIPIEEFAEAISKVYKKEILSILPNAKLYCEPGRFISHSAMHVLLKFMEIKHDWMGVVDGGNNMIGWEKYQFCNYVPIFNLSQFSKTNEIPFITYGSLCTPDDIWGYYLYTKGKPREGDVLLMPFQGAYTYTFSQEFIKEIPKVFDL